MAEAGLFNDIDDSVSSRFALVCIHVADLKSSLVLYVAFGGCYFL